ncbi:hypothetical protein RRG08_009965 [Elysia crispata]|uniref:Uncharacterized protein n=1 Tax=Elysia crispata TaxID=231223 RepID=A0AAE1B694_9GAST|nr:hypothetical protein RRG08_009965 [Elysia crispata]
MRTLENAVTQDSIVLTHSSEELATGERPTMSPRLQSGISLDLTICSQFAPASPTARDRFVEPGGETNLRGTGKGFAMLSQKNTTITGLFDQEKSF